MPNAGGDEGSMDYRLDPLTHAYLILTPGAWAWYRGLGSVHHALTSGGTPWEVLVQCEHDPPAEPGAIPQSWVPVANFLAVIADQRCRYVAILGKELAMIACDPCATRA